MLSPSKLHAKGHGSHAAAPSPGDQLSVLGRRGGTQPWKPVNLGTRKPETNGPQNHQKDQ